MLRRYNQDADCPTCSSTLIFTKPKGFKMKVCQSPLSVWNTYVCLQEFQLWNNMTESTFVKVYYTYIEMYIEMYNGHLGEFSSSTKPIIFFLSEGLY